MPDISRSAKKAMPIFATLQDAIDYLAINGALPAVSVDSSETAMVTSILFGLTPIR
jgi:hypothetical protein